MLTVNRSEQFCSSSLFFPVRSVGPDLVDRFSGDFLGAKTHFLTSGAMRGFQFGNSEAVPVDLTPRSTSGSQTLGRF